MNDPRTANPTVNTRISARGGLDVLSRDEVARLRATTAGARGAAAGRAALYAAAASA